MNLSETHPEFEALLDYLKQERGCDLTRYKRSTLMRRFQYRMNQINIDNYQCYLQYLQYHSQEYLELLNDVLINVTSFFRDPEVWDYLAHDIIPQMIASKQPDESIRVWSAGCSTGQEIYSLLILLAEALGIESCLQRVQSYATDADEVALRQARKGSYNHFDIIGIPPHLLEKYFKQTEENYVFHPQLRHNVIFGRHDLAQDAPISKIDLLICRNVLIYFTPEAQASILVRFHFALKNTGFLCLGQSEMIMNRRLIFTPINFKHRIFTKGLNLERKDNLLINPKPSQQLFTDSLPIQSDFWKTAFEMNPVPQLAIDSNGYLIRANDQANRLFRLTLNDWNRPFHELELGKQLASHISLQTVYRHYHSATLKKIEWVTSEGQRYFDLVITPIFKTHKQLLGITLTFQDTTHSKQLSQKLEKANSQIVQLSHKLEDTEAELKNTQMLLEAAHQEIEFLSQDINYQN